MPVSPARSPGLGVVPAGSARPLLLTSDEQLLDDLLRLAAAAGVDVDVAADSGAACSRLPRSPLIVVGEDQADGMVRLSPARGPSVVLVGRDVDDASSWRRGIALGAERVVFLPADESWLVSRFADAAEGEPAAAIVAGVMGGRGGAGASVLATGLALTAHRRGTSTALVDLDPLGGGLDLVLGAEGATGLRWPDLADSKGRLGALALLAELPDRHGLSVLSWDRGDVLAIPPETVKAALTAVRRGCDLVVLDLPRWPDEAADVAVGMCAVVLLVVPADVRSVAAASRVATGLTSTAPDVRVVTRASGGGVEGAEAASALGLPLGAHLAAESRLSALLDRGEPPGLDDKAPLSVGCRRLLDDIVRDYGAVTG